MLDFHKYLSLFLSTIMAVVSYVPVLIYSYIFSEFFTKYHSTHLEPHTVSSASAIREDLMLKMCLTLELPQDTLFTASSIVSEEHV